MLLKAIPSEAVMAVLAAPTGSVVDISFDNKQRGHDTVIMIHCWHIFVD